MTPPRLYDKGEHSAGVQPLCLGRGRGAAHTPSSPLGAQAQHQAPPPHCLSLNLSQPLQAGRREGALPSPALSAPTSGPRESRPRAESSIFPGAPSPSEGPLPAPGSHTPTNTGKAQRPG